MKFYRTTEDIAPLLKLNENEKARMTEILERYPMQIPEYYLNLIDFSDPDDPIRKMCIPSIAETDLDGNFDTSGEHDNTKLVGLQHKYEQTVIILSTERCAMYCRHCFRKRLVGSHHDEIAEQFEPMMNYIESHPLINNVLISGGDAFLNSNAVIEKYLDRLTRMEQLDFIRFGTRLPVTLPEQISKNKELLEILAHYNSIKPIYVMTQFNHPHELTPEALNTLRLLRNSVTIVRNQTVLLKGVNDDAQTLGMLLRGLTQAGVAPYYVFQCRPVKSVKSQFQVPLRRGLQIVEGAKSMQNGVGKSFRYCMSHPRGKIEIIGSAADDSMIFKFHEAKYAQDSGRIFQLEIDKNECWLNGEIPA